MNLPRQQTGNCKREAKGRRRSSATILTAIVFALVFSFAPGTGLTQDSTATGSTPQEVIQYLNQTIDWYRQLAVERQIATEPTDVMTVNDNRRVADQVVRLSFDFARAEAQALSAQAPSKPSDNANGDLARYQSLMQLAAKLDQQARETQAEIESFRQKLDTATGKQRKDLQTRIAETQSELDLINARRDAIRSMVDFVSGASTSGLGATGLRAQIEALARSVPADVTKSANTEPSNSATQEPVLESTAALNRPGPSGIWDLGAGLFALSAKNQALESRLRATSILINANKDLRAPLVKRLTELSKRGDELANQADAANDSTLADEKQELDALTAQFKQVSAALLPLSKQGVLLGLYKTSLSNWQSAVRARYRAEMRSLLLRVAILLVVLGVVFAFSELWRKTIYRYVHDARRRYQLLLLRKIVLWFAIVVIVAFAFATQLGSVATFAGLLTAGVAVALQNVILSVAGYFLLIGRFGIRVGDRVQISGVTGEVVEIGLVRLHVMELGGDGVDAPTGRVVAFSNSIVFQPTAGLFKQIPGTHFVWHEIRLTLAPQGDYHAVEERLLGAVEAVFADYREDMERQHRQLERTLSSNLGHGLQPKSWLRLTSSGLEAVVRYPVDLQHATEIDDRVTRELLKEIEREPKLNLIGSAHSAMKVTTDLTSDVPS